MDISSEDVNGQINCHSDPLTDDPTEITKSASEEKHKEEYSLEEVGLTLEFLSALVRVVKEMQKRVKEWDAQVICALQF